MRNKKVSRLIIAKEGKRKRPHIDRRTVIRNSLRCGMVLKNSTLNLWAWLKSQSGSGVTLEKMSNL